MLTPVIVKDVGALKYRYIPPDVKEDIRIGKVLPLSALIPVGMVFTGGVILSFIFKAFILKLIFLLVLPLMVILAYAMDLPDFAKKVTHWNMVKGKITNLDQLNGFKNTGSECVYKKNPTVKRTADMTDWDWEEERVKTLRKIFFEYTGVPPWEIDPAEYKEHRADEFAGDVFAAMQEGVGVSIYGTCKPERTNVLDRRMARLIALTPELQRLERDRIDFHYQFSKTAEDVSYIIGLSGKNDLENIPSFMSMGEGMQLLGDDIVESLVNTQITPGARMARGHEHMNINKPRESDDMPVGTVDIAKSILLGLPNRASEVLQTLKPKRRQAPSVPAEEDGAEPTIREGSDIRMRRRLG